MHTVTIKRDVYERDPWIAASLYRALEDAKNLAVKRMRFTAAPKYMLPWLYSDVDEIDEVFGGDPWPCGVQPNRPTLEALMKYMVEQHLIDKPVPLDKLFVPVPEGESKMPLR
jgi:4,5-dihydroxyphthalate decarboxylase